MADCYEMQNYFAPPFPRDLLWLGFDFFFVETVSSGGVVNVICFDHASFPDVLCLFSL